MIAERLFHAIGHEIIIGIGARTTMLERSNDVVIEAFSQLFEATHVVKARLLDQVLEKRLVLGQIELFTRVSNAQIVEHVVEILRTAIHKNAVGLVVGDRHGAIDHVLEQVYAVQFTATHAWSHNFLAYGGFECGEDGATYIELNYVYFERRVLMLLLLLLLLLMLLLMMW